MPADPPTSTTVPLHLNEACELAAAWAHALAVKRGIRALLIKGPTLHHHGLREERVSADVDLLVEPSRFDEFCEIIAAAGWAQRPPGLLSELTTLHSLTYMRGGWPCNLDVHRYYPGFLADPTDAFDALWNHRIILPFAHRDCFALDKPASVLILALHSLRGTSKQSRHAAELEQLVRAPLSDIERADLAQLAQETGCNATLESVLPRLGVEATPTSAELASPQLREWRERISHEAEAYFLWRSALRVATWSQRPRVAFRALWPTRRDLLAGRPHTVDSVFGRTRERLVRCADGLRSVRAGLRRARADRQLASRR